MTAAADVRIGETYLVRVSDVDTVVEIKEFVSSCCWLARNTRTGGQLYVLLSDLTNRASPAIEKPVPPVVDHKRAAAGDSE